MKTYNLSEGDVSVIMDQAFVAEKYYVHVLEDDVARNFKGKSLAEVVNNARNAISGDLSDKLREVIALKQKAAALEALAGQAELLENNIPPLPGNELSVQEILEDLGLAKEQDRSRMTPKTRKRRIATKKVTKKKVMKKKPATKKKPARKKK